MNWREARKLTKEVDLIKAAELVFDASPRFYSLFSTNKAALLKCIASQFSELGSEISDCVVAERDGAIAGIYCAYPANEIAARQQESLMAMFNCFPPEPETFTKLEAYRSLVAPLTASGYYLARITVAPEQRGFGLGSVLLKRFEDSVPQKSENPCFSLHVERDNADAISLYERNGYKRVPGAEDYTIIVFVKM